jgi:hypothetical protein
VSGGRAQRRTQAPWQAVSIAEEVKRTEEAGSGCTLRSGGQPGVQGRQAGLSWPAEGGLPYAQASLPPPPPTPPNSLGRRL